MFKNNDRIYYIAKIVLVVITVALVCASMFSFAYCLAQSGEYEKEASVWVGSAVGWLIGGLASSGLFFLIGSLCLSIMYDLKSIRDKLYNVRNSQFSGDREDENLDKVLDDYKEN
ncbi:MAG: DUF2721 domain-containing protein [Clostridiales bacterium]|nr:DUF2721 domain-containing protein [Clostridiales bacterium]